MQSRTPVFRRPWASAIAFLLALAFPPTLMTAPAFAESRLEDAIVKHLPDVREFSFIQEEAQRLGLRAWLFGGTAAAYAHYVKWDLNRLDGDQRYQANRFDYDYTNIYRATQDLDIVVDGPAAKAAELQRLLEKTFPHLQGSKTAWEVRLLKVQVGDKQPLLDNPDFLNQHTDSNSTGMIELTRPPHGEHVVRDLRSWNSRRSTFLSDVALGQIQYYFSDTHHQTRFFREGRNPPILSVVRYLTKAFQYELRIPTASRALIEDVIRDFDPARDMRNSYVQHWLLERNNGKKLLQSAVNMEYARKTLDELGLRKILIGIRGDVHQVDSLAWWLNRQPLETRPLGEGTGRTAEALGLKVVAHATNGFPAFESITKAHTGDPNVLISREGYAGEAAAYGDGFYTAVGRLGAVNSGYTIRFDVDPRAREGTDFRLATGGTTEKEYIVFRNRAALRVQPESLGFGPVQYFRFLAQIADGGNAISPADRGIFEQLQRRVGASIHHLSPGELNQIAEIVRSRPANAANVAIREKWLEVLGNHLGRRVQILPEQVEAAGVIELIQGLVAAPCEPAAAVTTVLSGYLKDHGAARLSGRQWDELRQAFVKLLDEPGALPVGMLRIWFSQPASPELDEDIRRLRRNHPVDFLALREADPAFRALLARKEYADLMPRTIEELIAISREPAWAENKLMGEAMLRALVEEGIRSRRITLLGRRGGENIRQLVSALLLSGNERRSNADHLIPLILEKGGARIDPEAFLELLCIDPSLDFRQKTYLKLIPRLPIAKRDQAILRKTAHTWQFSERERMTLALRGKLAGSGGAGTDGAAALRALLAADDSGQALPSSEYVRKIAVVADRKNWNAASFKSIEAELVARLTHTPARQYIPLTTILSVLAVPGGPKSRAVRAAARELMDHYAVPYDVLKFELFDHWLRAPETGELLVEMSRKYGPFHYGGWPAGERHLEALKPGESRRDFFERAILGSHALSSYEKARYLLDPANSDLHPLAPKFRATLQGQARDDLGSQLEAAGFLGRYLHPERCAPRYAGLKKARARR